jgi:hypothetical protein
VVGHRSAAFRENKHARMTYIFYKIYINTAGSKNNPENRNDAEREDNRTMLASHEERRREKGIKTLVPPGD